MEIDVKENVSYQPCYQYQCPPVTGVRIVRDATYTIVMELAG